MMLPVAVISFNRPDFLAQTLDSLKAQTVDFPIALFQDGPRKPSDTPLIDECVRAFRARFRFGEVYRSAVNLGPGLNIDRAEHWIFDDRVIGAGAIFEDDFVVSPHYLTTLQAMLRATRGDERVAYVSAVGPFARERPGPPESYVPMHLNWAYALTYHQWLKRKPLVDEYLAILRGRDYRERDIVAIMALREQWGMPGPYTTQDVMRAAATQKVGGIRINTLAHCGRYIGRRGLHIDPETYDAAGFAKTPIYPHRLAGFGRVTEDLVRRCRAKTEEFIFGGSEAA